LTLVALSALACSRDPRPGTPAAAAEGELLMRQMSAKLAAAPVFRFTTVESLEPVAGTGGRLLTFTREVTVLRPDAMVFDLAGTGDTTADVSVHYDGSTVSLRDNRNGVWAETTAPGTLDEMLDDVARRFSLPVPIGDVIYSQPYAAFIGPSTKGGFVGRETIDGIECARLSYSDALVGVEIWIALEGPRLPRRLELAYKQVPGTPRAHVDFKIWDLAPEVADGTFAFPPGEAASEIAFEQLVDRLLGRGDPTIPTAPEPSTTEAPPQP